MHVQIAADVVPGDERGMRFNRPRASLAAVPDLRGMNGSPSAG
jgi:hypothetical protein